ncbi:MAG: response regulator transcription factor [Actinobacteria bacterium]|nr:MAG: response regulator transcription factor [Actinomycetota bacterium]
MKVLVVDDHVIARRGLRTILRETFGLDDCAEAGDAAAALALAVADPFDLVLLDMHLPGPMSAVELCRRLRVALPAAAVVLVTAFDRSDEIRRCLAAGADGCLLKDTSEVDMTVALRMILTGGRVIDPRIAFQLVRGLAGEPAPAGSRVLTAREREVLDLLAEGLSNRAIARRLGLSEATVKGYVSNVLDKLHASSRLEALVRAADTGLI